MKKIFAILVCASIAFAAAAWAQTAKPATTATPSLGQEQLTDAGNKTCPISGDKVSGKDFVTYKGVRYGLCCASCASTFLKEPDKYIQKLKDKGEIK